MVVIEFATKFFVERCFRIHCRGAFDGRSVRGRSKKEIVTMAAMNNDNSVEVVGVNFSGIYLLMFFLSCFSSAIARVNRGHI